MSDAHGHGIWTRDHVFLGDGHAAPRPAPNGPPSSPPCSWWWRSSAACLSARWRFWPTARIWRPMSGRWGWRRAPIGWRGVTAAAAASPSDRASSATWRPSPAPSSWALTAIAVAVESVHRIVTPAAVQYGDALLIACIGLGVNLVSALILKGDHSHHHGHSHDGIPTAMTTICAPPMSMCWPMPPPRCWPSSRWPRAIISGLAYLDPLCGLVGAAVIAVLVLWLDPRQRHGAAGRRCRSAAVARKSASSCEDELGARVADLHLWRLGPGHHGLIVSLISPDATSAEAVKAACAAAIPTYPMSPWKSRSAPIAPMKMFWSAEKTAGRTGGG